MRGPARERRQLGWDHGNNSRPFGDGSFCFLGRVRAEEERDLGWSEPSGRFYLPGQCEERTRVVHAVTGSFEDQGYEEIVLPTLIYAGAESVPGMSMPVEKAYRFLDKQGSLLMLRPDMTPVVARYVANLGTQSPLPLRLYYQGSVFRSEDPGGGKRNEFLQVGGEVIGAECDSSQAVRMVALAARCLANAGVRDYRIGIGHRAALSDVLAALDFPRDAALALKTCLDRSDLVAFDHLLRESGMTQSGQDLVAGLVARRDGREALRRLREAVAGETGPASIALLYDVLDGLDAAGLGGHVYLDLALSRSFDYYSGFVMEGYAPGAGMPVLGGGAYELRRAGATAVPAAGFALDIDLIADALLKVGNSGGSIPADEDCLSIALPSGRLLAELKEILESSGVDCSPGPDSPRSLVFRGRTGIRAMVVRPSDVPTYVEQGAADLGVAGEDVLAESRKDVTEVLDLEAGVCRMVLATSPANGALLNGPIVRPLRIATKYPGVAAGYFQARGIPVEIVRLSGSIEVAPLTGLADAIVDICSTGATLKDNGLCAFQDVLQVSARLIANRASLRLKRERVAEVVSALRARVDSRRRSR